MFVRKPPLYQLTLFFSCLSFVIGSILFQPKFAQAAPFTCSTGLYQEVSGQLRVLDTVNNTFTTIGPNHGFNINAIGYNPVDNYIYGMDYTNSHLLRIESDGTYTDLGVPAGLPGTAYNAGDFDQAGNLYVKSNGNVYIIDVIGNTATPLVLSTAFATADFVHINGFLYGIGVFGDAGNIFSVDITNGNVTSTPIALPADGGYGSGWATDVTSLYFASNTTGIVYRITDYTTLPIVTPVMNSTPTIENDGAACFTAPTPIPDISATNKAGSTPFNQQLIVLAASGLLVGDTGKNITVTSYTQPTNGTVAVNPDGSYTYTPNAGYSGEDAFTYTITDAFDYTATATVTITVAGNAIVPTTTVTGTLADSGSDQTNLALIASFTILVGVSTLLVAYYQPYRKIKNRQNSMTVE